MQFSFRSLNQNLLSLIFERGLSFCENFVYSQVAKWNACGLNSEYQIIWNLFHLWHLNTAFVFSHLDQLTSLWYHIYSSDHLSLTLHFLTKIFLQDSPWYNHTGWLDVKRQLTYLLPFKQHLLTIMIHLKLECLNLGLFFCVCVCLFFFSSPPPPRLSCHCHCHNWSVHFWSPPGARWCHQAVQGPQPSNVSHVLHCGHRRQQDPVYVCSTQGEFTLSDREYVYICWEREYI